MRRLRFKPSLADQQRMSVAAQRFLAEGAPPEKRAAALAFVEQQAAAIPAKRIKADPTSSIDIDAIHRKQAAPLEKETQKAILDYLRRHPRVQWAHRFNRGTVQSSYNGRASYTMFNTCKGFSDIHFLMKNGVPGYCEVKRLGAHTTPDQEAFLASCAATGAIAFVAYRIEDVIAALGS